MRLQIGVWGWTKEKFESRAGVLSDIARYIDLALQSGLTHDDIVDDIVEQFPMFEDGNLEEENSSLLNLILVPVEPTIAAN